jgi:hypothetical protein
MVIAFDKSMPDISKKSRLLQFLNIRAVLSGSARQLLKSSEIKLWHPQKVSEKA